MSDLFGNHFVNFTDEATQILDNLPVFSAARKECEDLRAQGSDKHAETRLENLKHDLEKQIHDLQHKNKVDSSNTLNLRLWV